jgi:hypothetical protein
VVVVFDLKNKTAVLTVSISNIAVQHLGLKEISTVM